MSQGLETGLPPGNQGPAPGVLYVYNLILGAGATLDLNGLQLYYEHENLGTGASFLGGSPPQVVPLPASAWLFLSGLVGLGVLGSKEEKEDRLIVKGICSTPGRVDHGPARFFDACKQIGR